MSVATTSPLGLDAETMRRLGHHTVDALIYMLTEPDVPALRRLQVGADVFGFFKTEEDGPIDEVTGDDFYLGFEPDVYLNWQITSDITLAIRYGIFFPDEDNFATDKPRQLLYAGVTFAF